MTGNARVRDLPPDLTWRKSSFSTLQNCLEAARLPDGAGVAVRTSRQPDGVAIVYTREEFSAAIEGIKAGEFDELV